MGAEIDAQDYEGRTPLHMAAKCGSMESCELLIENVVSRVNDNSGSIDSIGSLIDGRLLESLEAAQDRNIGSSQGAELTNDEIMDLANVLQVDELNLFDANGEVIQSSFPENIGYIVDADHPVSTLLASEEITMIEESAREDESGVLTGFYKYGVIMTPQEEIKLIKEDLKYNKEFKEYIDLQQKYSVQPTTSLDYSKQMEELFSNGKVALSQQGNWVYGTIDEIDPEFAETNVGILPVPIDGVSEQKLPVGVPNYWAFNKNSSDKEQEEAKKFIDWLYTSEQGKKTVIEDFKFIPAYNGYDADKIADPLSKEVYDYSSKGNTTGWVFMGYPTDWGMNVLGAGIQKYVSDEATWEELMKEVKTSWDDSRK